MRFYEIGVAWVLGVRYVDSRQTRNETMNKLQTIIAKIEKSRNVSLAPVNKESAQ